MGYTDSLRIPVWLSVEIELLCRRLSYKLPMSKTTTNTLSESSRVSNELPSETVIRKVAAAEGVDELDLQPLYDVCDPDALNAIFRSTGQRVVPDRSTVQFRYHGYTVRVNADGQVRLLDDG